ncbi:MAG: hypothetical protein J1E98_09725 [Lachnospiraceae bacterium]|nr:hypothetical protein [Lachnospiraceae bacterium]
MDKLSIKDKEYIVIKLLGHGKGGYSYLVSDENRTYVLKQIHHEPCDYYNFGNKIEAEKADYEKLDKAGILIPQMLDIDEPNERLLKEYIEGDTVYDLILSDKMKPEYLEQVRQMSELAYKAGLNIDYFPTNFVVQDETLYYIDYECNSYMEEWNFENWGIKYWSKTPEFLRYVEEHLNRI